MSREDPRASPGRLRKSPYQHFNLILVLLLLSVLFYVYLAFHKHLYYVLYHQDIKLTAERKLHAFEHLVNSLRQPQPCNGYCKRAAFRHVDCQRLLYDNVVDPSLTGENRLPLIENQFLNMSCEAIRRRVQWGPGKMERLEKKVAFARIVYQDYEFLEKQVQVSWHPENVFCFVVDSHASESFKERMRALAGCLDNTVMLPVTEHYDGAGHNINLGHYRCMEALLHYTWDYLILLQNHDLITKTVFELSRIFEIYNGANDVTVSFVDPKRVNPKHKWDPRSLKLFSNESGVEESVLDTPMRLSSGAVQVSLARETVDWMVNTVDATGFINQWNQTEYGGDEQFMSSFMANPQLKMPGHFTNECLDQGISAPAQVTRMVTWDQKDNWNNCPTKTSRHQVCIAGIEDFERISKVPFIFFNKVIPDFDYTIVECMAELLYNRTFSIGYSNEYMESEYQLNETFYRNILQVQYHHHHKDPDYKLQCTPNFTP